MKYESAREAGFTLVELLVALAIFALMSVAGVALLRSGSDTQLAVKSRLEDLSRASLLYNLLEGDLAQAVARPFRDTAGQPMPAFSQGGSGLPGQLFGLVRAGWSNFDDAPRAGLQHVAYVLDGKMLKRVSWPMLDGAGPGEAATMIENVTSARLRYRDNRGDWRSDWSATDPYAMPRAIELRLTIGAMPEQRMLFLVGPQTRVMAGTNQPAAGGQETAL